MLPALPFKLALADRRRAVMPLHMDPPLIRDVLIEGSTMVVALVELFERMWREAFPFRPGSWQGDGETLPEPAADELDLAESPRSTSPASSPKLTPPP
ncbi:hypothetical protein Pth03_80480 [Planotetraspora thailandica]|uniref:Uncharacterized protein n=1 Tax=Planotetraspora thailandica TaxID=487172 RepID=A0A8J3Y2R9_9ACTN|nr:hypothetical protein [Planotetraspora thailandica]GII59659.1 hypothetical protein Pth03_80480 [Planotetraspora thailandica]